MSFMRQKFIENINSSIHRNRMSPIHRTIHHRCISERRENLAMTSMWKNMPGEYRSVSSQRSQRYKWKREGKNPFRTAQFLLRRRLMTSSHRVASSRLPFPWSMCVWLAACLFSRVFSTFSFRFSAHPPLWMRLEAPWSTIEERCPKPVLCLGWRKCYEFPL